MSDLDDLDEDQLAQGIISDERFREWITNLDFPDPSQDSIMPMLFVGSLAKNGGPLQLTLIAIAGDAFNVTKQRFAIMRMLGARCFDDKMKPVAVALISEVWTRSFTPEEGRARGKRQVSDYEDREECVMLCGCTIDGRGALIKAPILRDTGAVITGYGPRVSSYDEKAGVTKVEPTLLMEFFRGYLAKKFAAARPAHTSH